MGVGAIIYLHSNLTYSDQWRLVFLVFFWLVPGLEEHRVSSKNSFKCPHLVSSIELQKLQEGTRKISFL